MDAELWSDVWVPVLAILAVAVSLLMYVGGRMKDRHQAHSDERSRAVQVLTVAGELVAAAEAVAATSQAGALLVRENAQLAGHSLGSPRQLLAEGELSAFTGQAAALAEDATGLLANPDSLRKRSDAELAHQLATLKVARAKMDGLRSRANEFRSARQRENGNLRQLPRKVD